MMDLLKKENQEVGLVVDELISKLSSNDHEPGNHEEIVIQEEIEIEIQDNDESSSPLKRRKDANDLDSNETELVSLEDKENISKRLHQMTRKELEDLVLVKVVETIVKHSQAGKLRNKVVELQAQKDKMFQRVGHLQKQVQEMSRALKLLVDNHNRDPNNLNPNKKRPPPIKFFRSVGLQVTFEPSYRNGPTKVIHVNNENPINGFKSMNGAVYTVNQNAQPGNKVNIKPKISQGTTQYVRVVNGTSPTKGSQNGPNILKNNVQQQIGSTSKVVNNISSPTVVDLTDDPNATSSQASNVVTASNGVQYRILNTTTSQGGVQVIPSQQAYQIVTTSSGSSQVRPIYLTQSLPGQNRGAQTLVVRNGGPRQSGPVNFNQTPRPSVVARPAGVVGSGGKVAATIGTMVRAPTQVVAQRKFQLPPLPGAGVVSVPRGRAVKELPSRPSLSLTEQSDGIVLSWTLKITSLNAEVGSYQLYACQESLSTTPGKISNWKKVGDVKALPLPMACTLSQFTQGNRYFFIVRAVDVHGRTGPFCDPAPIILQKK